MNGFLASQHASDDDDVNVKSNYVDCWYIAPKTRALLETPRVPPLAHEEERG
ncbi:Hypothetical protein A7982_07516 [Minicystis rosea]|nr:Hypothetical protein A7982_07516 [Minicystis rosea]